LRLEDLAAITDRDEVVSIHYGREQEVQLDRSVPQIRANLVWTLGGPPNFTFTGNPGTDVIIGIIDTGADFRHPFLWLDSVPQPVTRILRIWDMGLTPTGAETLPDVALLEGGAGGTYGVEYSESQINDVLQGTAGALPIRHRDCKSHGTHVASIAGGDGRFAFSAKLEWPPPQPGDCESPGIGSEPNGWSDFCWFSSKD
jgi:subtilisin family serine protease